MGAIVEDARAILGKGTGGATSVAERSRDQTERGGVGRVGRARGDREQGNPLMGASWGAPSPHFRGRR